MPVSAGAHLAHVRLAVALGCGFYVGLSAIPEETRPAVVAEIEEFVDRASGQSVRHGIQSGTGSPHSPG